MTPTLSAPRITADEFLEMPEADGYELVDGELVEVPMGKESNWIGGELFGEVRAFARAEGLGRAFPQDSGIKVWDDDPDRVRKPDMSFYKRGRLPDVSGRGWLTTVPDLVAEVVSPNDKADDLQKKIQDYRNAGIPLIWVIFPQARMAHVYRRGRPVEELAEEASLDGEDILPGFACSLAELFASVVAEP